MTVAVIKKSFKYIQTKDCNYSSYKNFSIEAFSECLLEKFLKEDLETTMTVWNDFVT